MRGFCKSGLPVLVLATVLIFGSCGKTKEDFKSIKDFSYFPVAELNFLEYEVDSIFFEKSGQSNRRDTFNYIVKETLQEVEEVGDQVCARYNRSVFSGEASTPVSVSTYLVCRDQKTGWTLDNGIQLIHLVFPFNENTTWNALSMILKDSVVEYIRENPIRTFKNWHLSGVDQMNTVFEVGAEQLTDVVRVVQVDSDNLLERRYSEELFASGIGLVYRERHILETQNIGALPWIEKAERGYICKWRLINYEK
jgi:hypothetical protein